MAMQKSPRKAKRPASQQIVAGATPDAQFLALLRRQCLRAASIGALTAAGESIPGLSSVLGLLFGELLDAKLLGNLQRELIEQTLVIYGVELPAAVRGPLVSRVQMLGTGASVASDAMLRQLVRRSFGSLGRFVVARVVPLTAIASSAFSNAAVTYALGKRAQAVAKLRNAPLAALPDALRAFSGVDERRLIDWTIEATRSSIGTIGGALKWLVRKPAKTAKKARRRRARPAA